MCKQRHAFERSIWLLILLPGLIAGGRAPERKPLQRGYGKLPLSFEANRGQTDGRVQFLARGNGYTLFLTSRETVLKLKAPGERAARVVRLRWDGANPAPRADGLDELPGKSNYFIGNDAAKWRTNIPSYARVRYRQVYSGVDLVFRNAQGSLEYDLEVAAGADPGLVRFTVEGANRLRVDAAGDLVLEIGRNVLRQRRPLVYQEVDGARRVLEGRYVLRGKRTVGFEVAGRDPDKALTIDPILVYSTFLGGSNTDWAPGIAVDALGKTYVAGSTYSTDFPIAGGVYIRKSGLGDVDDVFVAKLNGDGTALEYSTYLGGRLSDEAWRIRVDSSGKAYVVGYTASADFPRTPNAYQLVYGGGQHDAFLAILNPAGSTLVYSTFLGGNQDDGCYDIALDNLNRVYLTGYTSSSNFPTTPGALRTGPAGGADAFVAKLDPALGQLIYSTYLGGSDNDYSSAIKVNDQYQAYVAGLTYSTDFPTTPGVFQPQVAGHDDSFVAKLNPSGTALIFSTYLGGNCEEETYGLALDRDGNAYLTGYVETKNFPATPGAFQTSHHGGADDAFVAKVDVTGAFLHYATYLGGSDNDVGGDIAVDTIGNAYILGYTKSADFPTTPAALQSTFNGEWDAFLVKLNRRGSHLGYSTYLGGRGEDYGRGLALDAAGDLYLSGWTNYGDYPTTPGVLQPTFGGAWDAFISKLRLPTITTVSAASFLPGMPVAPESIAAGFGPELSPTTESAAPGQAWPTTLAGVSVRVKDSAGIERLAPLVFVSAGQINYLVPPGTSGGVASVTVTRGDQVTNYGLLDIEPTGPGLFTANFDGQGPPAAIAIRVRADNSQSWLYVYQCGSTAGSCVPVPLDLGPATDQVFLELYGTGIRGVGSLSAVSARIGGVDAEVRYAGPQGALVGLDQVNVLLPRSLVGRGELDLALTVDRKTSNPVRLNIR
jgi:uncharacterized protein (TIGR03437 family)